MPVILGKLAESFVDVLIGHHLVFARTPSAIIPCSDARGNENTAAIGSIVIVGTLLVQVERHIRNGSLVAAMIIEFVQHHLASRHRISDRNTDNAIGACRGLGVFPSRTQRHSAIGRNQDLEIRSLDMACRGLRFLHGIGACREANQEALIVAGHSHARIGAARCPAAMPHRTRNNTLLVTLP